MAASPLRPFERTHAKRGSGVFNTADLASGSVDEGLEDGPVFMATVQGLERGAQQFKMNLRQLIKAANGYIDAGRALDVASADLVTACKALEPLEPACRYLDDLFGKMRGAQEAFHNNIQSLLIEPLERLYENDLKQLDAQKANFDRASQTFNQVVEKYLATDRDKKEHKLDKTDQKFHTRRTEYNLIRFDYLTFVEELHTRKEQEVLFFLNSVIEKHTAYLAKLNRVGESLKPSRDELDAQVAEIGAELNNRIRERQEIRQSIQRSSQAAGERLIERAMQHAANAGAAKKTNKYSGIRDLQHAENAAAAAAAGAAAQAEVKQGFLYTKQNREWKKTWVVISSGVLSEYLHYKSGPKNGTTTDLRTCTVKPAFKAERRFCFELISPQTKRLFQTTSEEETAIWMQVIQRAIEVALERRVSFKDLRNSIGSSPEDKDNVRNEIMLDPSNEACADCGVKDTDWCAINLGLCLCIGCSGFHRSLGVHITKVRSFTLDTSSWTAELIGVQRGLGNAATNAVLEYDLPEDQRPPPTATREARQAFVQQKYVQHAFIEKMPDDRDATRELIAAVMREDLAGVIRALAWGANVNQPGGYATVADASDSDPGDAISPAPSGNLLSPPSPLSTPLPAPTIKSPIASISAAAAAAVIAARTASGSPAPSPSSTSSPSSSASASTVQPMMLPDETPEAFLERLRPGMPALHVAICLGMPVVAELLLQNGADVNGLDRYGNAPVHYAALRRDDAAVTYLVGKGAKYVGDSKGGRGSFRATAPVGDGLGVSQFVPATPVAVAPPVISLSSSSDSAEGKD